MTPPAANTCFLSTLKPFYSPEESTELMDIGIHAVISLQPPGEDNESVKVGFPGGEASLFSGSEPGSLHWHRQAPLPQTTSKAAIWSSPVRKHELMLAAVTGKPWNLRDAPRFKFISHVQ